MGIEHKVLLYHTKVQWLSRGHVFTRVYELRKEIDLLLCDKGNMLHQKLSDNDFITSLAYMFDVFTLLMSSILPFKAVILHSSTHKRRKQASNKNWK